MIMEDDDWDALASELVRQNYAFVTAFSVILWDCLITFRQEAKYVWHCPSRVTKYLFLFCRYYAMGYFIACSIFGTQWTLRVPTARNDCRTWVLIHEGSLGLLYMGSPINPCPERSTLLAAGLFALHCIQVVGSFILSHHISGQLNFNPICTGRNVPNIALFILVSITCNQCITWALILRKVRPTLFPSWRRYLCTSEAHARISCALCLVAVLIGSSHSFANQRLASVYAFTYPVVVTSMGTCRCLLRVEKDRATLAKPAESINTTDGKGGQSVDEEQSHHDSLPRQNQYQVSCRPHLPTAMLPPSNREASGFSTQHFSSELGGCTLDTVFSNFPYLHGAQSYISKLRRNRSSMATTITTDHATGHSTRSSLDYAGPRTASVHRSSWGSRAGSDPSLRANCAAEQNDIMSERNCSASNLEIGSLQSSSTVNSEELRQFDNATWNLGPFMAGGL